LFHRRQEWFGQLIEPERNGDRQNRRDSEHRAHGHAAMNQAMSPTGPLLHTQKCRKRCGVAEI